MNAFRQRPIVTMLAVMIILAGAFICIAGTYVFVKESGLLVVDVIVELNNRTAHLPILRHRDDRQAVCLLNWDVT